MFAENICIILLLEVPQVAQMRRLGLLHVIYMRYNLFELLDDAYRCRNDTSCWVKGKREVCCCGMYFKNPEGRVDGKIGIFLFSS